MKPYHWAFIGLTLDIIGAFLLAVEAIKIDNFRKLKARFLSPIHKATISPEIKFVEDKIIFSASKKHLLFYNGLHNLAGLLLLVGIDYILNGWLFNQIWGIKNWLIEKPWYVILIISLIVIIYGLIAGLWMLGELVHISITKITKLSLNMVDFIDAKTPDGTIGIIGFLLLLSGFLFQMLSAYLGANPN